MYTFAMWFSETKGSPMHDPFASSFDITIQQQPDLPDILGTYTPAVEKKGNLDDTINLIGTLHTLVDGVKSKVLDEKGKLRAEVGLQEGKAAMALIAQVIQSLMKAEPYLKKVAANQAFEAAVMLALRKQPLDVRDAFLRDLASELEIQSQRLQAV